MSRITEAYGRMVGAFGIKGRFYGPQGHRGTDFARSRGQIVPAYETGVCVDMGYSSYIGHWVILRFTRDGRYAGWCHLISGTRPDIGQRVKPNGQVGLVAGWGDNPGSSWSGSHIHTTLSNQKYGIYEGWNLNPYPRIKKALRNASRPTAPKPKPIPKPKPKPKEEGTTVFPLRVKMKKGPDHIYTIGQEYLKYEKDWANAQLTKDILTVNDKFHTITERQFRGVLASFGVPFDVPAKLRAKTMTTPHVWSRTNEVESKLNELLARK